MEAARTVFARVGYEKASMTQIAKAGGIVEGTIYLYFKNKHDLLVKVLEAWYLDIMSGYEAHLRGIHGTRNRLRFMIWYNMQILDNNRDLCRLLVVHIRSKSNYKRTKFYEMNRKYSDQMLAVLRQGIASGEFRSDAPLEMIRDAIFGATEYFIGHYIRDSSEKQDIGEAADTLTALLCQALVGNRYFDGLSIPVRLGPAADRDLGETEARVASR